MNLTEVMKQAVKKLGVAPGTELWVNEDICLSCPDKPCNIGCKGYGTTTVQKVTVKEVRIIWSAETEPGIVFNAGGLDYLASELGVSIFKSKEEAEKHGKQC